MFLSFNKKKIKKKYAKTKSEPLQVGSFVYVDFPSSSFEKSFDSKNYQLFIISRVDAGKSPILFQVKDLLGKVQPGFYYREQLLKTHRPRRGQYFRVEAILKEKEQNNKKKYLVKFLHYPSKFNRWISKENMIL